MAANNPPPLQKCCLYCNHSANDIEALKTHYKIEHKKIKKHPCATCGNRFKDKLESKHHHKRGHYREIPYDLVADVLGESAYVGASHSEFHRLMRNGIPPPENSTIPPVTEWERDYETRAFDEEILMVAKDKKKKSTWWKSSN